MKRIVPILALLAFVASACDQQDPLPTSGKTGPLLSTPEGTFPAAKTDGDPSAAFLVQLNEMNAALDAQGAEVRVVTAEWIAGPGAEYAGNTVLANNVGNKQLADDFVPFDPRRVPWSGALGATDDITYAVDQTTDAAPFAGYNAAQATAAIDRSMVTWNDVNCSTLPITKVSDGGVDIGYVAASISGGAVGSFNVVADLQQGGFRDLNFAGGVLGVTYTLVWVDDEGNPTDIDGNGKNDVAFREIYYDPSWLWDDGTDGIDLESVALHEAGHGLSQAHFGKVMIKNNGDLKAAPRAVMNALYSNPLRDLLGSDNGGHCSNWAQWPTN